MLDRPTGWAGGPDAFDARVDGLTTAIAANAPLSVRASEAGNRTFDSADYAEGRTAFRERRTPRFTDSQS